MARINLLPWRDELRAERRQQFFVSMALVAGLAIATLFPITWQEPFGLVMAESMASGTPVIAMNLGAAAEVVADGKTGFLGNTVDECVAAVTQVTHLNRRDCRDHVEANFSVQRMVDGYEAVYRQVLSDRLVRNGQLHSAQLINTQGRVA